MFAGTWIPLEAGRELAQRYNVFDHLAPIFNFVPGDQSPPPAPRQSLNRPRVRRSSVAKVEVQSSRTVTSQPPLNVLGHEPFSLPSSQGRVSPDHAPDAARWRKRAGNLPTRDTTLGDIPIDPELTDSAVSSEVGDDMTRLARQPMAGRKRRRQVEVPHPSSRTPTQQDHLFFGDELLDHLMVFRDAGPEAELGPHPEPPPNFHPDTPVDDAGHRALHWGAALADTNLVSDFIARGANIGVVSNLGETPLTFASQYTNSYQRRTMPHLISLLGSTIAQADLLGFTALHHAATLTSQPNLAPAGRYYFETILGYLSQNLSPHDLSRVLDTQNVHGDTALIIVARQGDQASVRKLTRYGASMNIKNDAGKSAEDYLQEREERAQWRREANADAPPPALEIPARAATRGIDGAAVNADPVDEGFDTMQNGWHPRTVVKQAAGASRVGGRLAQRVNEPLEHELTRIAADDAEITAALARVETQRSQIRARSSSLRNSNFHEEDEDNTAEVDMAAFAASEEELSRLLKAFERRELVRHVQAVASQRGSQPVLQPEEQLQLATAIEEQEQRHSRLLSELVQKTALAGSPERSAQYKRLIARCLNIGEDDIQALAPAILEHLEAERERKTATVPPVLSSIAAQ